LVSGRPSPVSLAPSIRRRPSIRPAIHPGYSGLNGRLLRTRQGAGEGASPVTLKLAVEARLGTTLDWGAYAQCKRGPKVILDKYDSKER
jgi:hypothetical protein